MGTPTKNMKLTLDYVLNLLLDDQLISKQQYTQFKSTYKPDNNQIHPLVILANKNWKTPDSYVMTLEKLTQWLAEKTNIPYIRIDPIKIDVSAITGLVSQAYATNLKILPVEMNNKELVVANCEPFFDSWQAELARIANRKIKRVLANPKDIDRYLVEFYELSQSVLGAKIKSDKNRSKIHNFEQLVEIGKSNEPNANVQHTVSIVDWLLQFAFEQRASDIHLEPRKGKSKVRFRIDGILHEVHEFPSILMDAISNRLKSLGRMDITDKRRPQDGRIKSKNPSGEEIEMRLSTLPTAFGEKLVIRIFNPEMLYKNFTQLGFNQHDNNLWQQITASRHGMILVTGPTGSGKTTTLYSTLNKLVRPEDNICTIEDPIEMIDERLNQMQVQRAIDVDFAAGVRALLRQDPDIIMIGEIRDFETADVAIQAALTGHLVLSSLHTNDAPSAFTRLVDLGAQPFLINASLRGILAQRLIRTLCQHCKQNTTMDKTLWDKLITPFKLVEPKKYYQSIGCHECKHTGYFGRIGIYEILSMNAKLQETFSSNTNSKEIRSTAIKQNMRSLRISGAQKIAEGLTTVEEILSVVPHDLDKF